MTTVVSNSSPLIAFTQIGKLVLLKEMFTEILIPPAVAREVASSVPVVSWIKVTPITDQHAAEMLGIILDSGESEAIQLALESACNCVILDEARARRYAIALGLPVIGTLGLLIKLKSIGKIKLIQPVIESLLKHEFRISSRLIEAALKSAGE